MSDETKPPVSRADARLIAEAASDCAKVASYWKERALSSEAGISEFTAAEAAFPPMTQPDLARLAGLVERANARQAPDQSYVEWSDARMRARFEIVDLLPELLARIAALEEALEPFAAIGDRTVHLRLSPDDPIVTRARAVLTLKENDDVG